jgi:hypothetical protein
MIRTLGGSVTTKTAGAVKVAHAQERGLVADPETAIALDWIASSEVADVVAVKAAGVELG